MAYLDLENISITIKGDNGFQLQPQSFSINKGNCIAIIGESGSGKSTLLRLIAGLEKPNSGNLILDNTNINSTPPHKRQIGYLFQDYALFPHLSIADNIAFGLNNTSKTNKSKLVAKWLKVIGLPNIQNKYPHQLSGGEQQRVALARTMVTQPKLLLLDEPFSNLDVLKQKQLKQEVKAIINEYQTTTILVTHDPNEAAYFANTILVLKEGKAIAQGTIEAVKTSKDEYVQALFNT